MDSRGIKLDLRESKGNSWRSKVDSRRYKVAVGGAK